MGTSTPRTGPTGGHWSVIRGNTTRYARTRESKYAERAIRAYVRGSGDGSGGGGGGDGGGSSSAGAAAGARLGGFLSTLATEGLDAALIKFDLDEHVGKDRWDVLEAVQSFLMQGHDDQHVEQAFIEVLGAIYGEEPQTYEEMQEVGITTEEVEDFLELMVTHTIFNGIVPTLHETLAKEDPENVDELEAEFLGIIHAEVEVNLGGKNPSEIDWLGPEGQAIIFQARTNAENMLRGDDS